MAREIKFRAKVKQPDGIRLPLPPYFKEGEWVQGDLHSRCKIPHIHPCGNDKFPIDVNTIGQFIGMLDKNGKEIYEGDIVKTDISRMNATKNKTYRNFAIRYDAPMFWNGYDSLSLQSWRVEVIGNIYDNPELLK